MSMELVTQDIYALEDTFTQTSVDSAIKFQAEAGFALQALASSQYLLKVASGNRQSLADAVMNVAAIGISLNPAKKQAYLVPRNGAICLDISYRGMADMATMSGSIRWVQAKLVRANDSFQLNGIDQQPTHDYDPFAEDDDRGQIVGVYAVAKTPDGDYLTHTMSIARVLAIRDRSDAWKSFVSKKAKSCPWATDEEQMILKTCIKQGHKTWPRSERLESAIHYMDTRGGEGIDFAAEAGPEHEAPARGKPAVQMPRARDEVVTDVEAKPVQQKSADGDTRQATQGEINWVVRKLESLGLLIEQAAVKAGINLTAADDMTRADFVALRGVLA